MTDRWPQLRSAALDALSTLGVLLGERDPDEARLIAAYLEAKRALARAFEALGQERYRGDVSLGHIKREIEQYMVTTYRGLPAKYLVVRGFGRSHELLAAHLTARVGVEVSAAELRILTGDAIHTERRTRELRDLGLALDARVSGGINMYVLQSTTVDLARAAAVQVAKNIRGDKSLGQIDRAALLRRVEGS